MVTVSISETYDLSTVKDKMTLIGIHTPKKELIQKSYPGLCMNFKYCRIVKTDVVLSAVSGTVAITPDMVGTASTDIAPEDILNPILYKATSNDSWSTLEARLMGLMETNLGNNYLSGVIGNQAFAENDAVTHLADEFGVYYALLSNRDGFRIAPIQHGLEMRGLRPLVFEKYYAHGENQYVDSTQYNNDVAPGIQEVTVSSEPKLRVTPITNRAMRGNAHFMPKFNCTLLTSTDPDYDSSYVIRENGMGDGTPKNSQTQMPTIMPVMLGCIIMPPCRRTKLFFRMIVRTYLEFTECRPMAEIASFTGMSAQIAPDVYHSDYNTQAKFLDEHTDMVDVKNASIEKIMEGR